MRRNAKICASFGGNDESSGQFPPQVESLVGREKEVASIVYKRGASTAREIQACLSASISNAAVRSMLMRLVSKGVLLVLRGHRGPGQPSVYFPTSTPQAIKNRALRQLSDRYFEGSLLKVAMAALDGLQHEANAADARPNHLEARTLQGIVTQSFAKERRV